MKNKLLILKNEISSYNVPVYNEIAKYFDLTVGYYLKDKSKQDCFFKKKQFVANKIGPLIFIKELRDYVCSFDIVSIVPDLHVVSYCLLPFLKRNYKVVSWSIGFRVSYKHPYITTRRHTLADYIFQCVISHCDASIFYMEKAKEFWLKTGLDMNQVFVAPNTADIQHIDIVPEKKKSILFVGTLYKGKGVDKLLIAVRNVIEKGSRDVKLTIIGDGECKKELEYYVLENGLKENVTFAGAIFDERMLAVYFSEALLCISPTQGGLSCPKSMGYGVPFVTRKDAITGGEIYHIISGVNGIIYERDEELTTIIEDAYKNTDKYINMGIAAKEYYKNNATIKHMSRGALDAFFYALSH